MILKKELKTLSTSIEKLQQDIIFLKKELIKAKKTIGNNSDKLIKTNSTLRTHVNEPLVSINIKEKNGKWGDWTGAFNLPKNEVIKHLFIHVEKHFNKYFKENNPRKEFAIILSIDKERKIYKTIKT